MLSKLIQMLFVPKRARTKMAARRKAPLAPQTASPPSLQGGPAAPKADAGNRDKLMTDVMAVYRQQRHDVYDTLDDETKRQIEEDAEKAFGKLLHPKA